MKGQVSMRIDHFRESKHDTLRMLIFASWLFQSDVSAYNLRRILTRATCCHAYDDAIRVAGAAKRISQQGAAVSAGHCFRDISDRGLAIVLDPNGVSKIDRKGFLT